MIITDNKAFTLIELLIVIAILAILVIIVLVAINPTQRIVDANRQSTSASVNQMGKAVSTCITNLLGQNQGLGVVTDGAHCGTPQVVGSAITYLKSNGYTNLTTMPTNTAIKALVSGCGVGTCVDVCVYSFYSDVSGIMKYNNFQYTTGAVKQGQVASC